MSFQKTLDEDDDGNAVVTSGGVTEEVPVVAEEEAPVNVVKGSLAFQALQSRTFKQEMYKPMSKVSYFYYVCIILI